MRSLPILLFCHAALAETAAPDKADLQVVTDGKGHYVAFSPKRAVDALYYGDGKTFWLQRSPSHGGETTPEGVWKKFNFSFWEPRVAERYQASFDYNGVQYAVQCDTRKTALKALPAEEGQKLLASAKLEPVKWTRRAHQLMRDEQGHYYYVDVLREGGTGHRLYVGPKGQMKLQKMTNIVADSEGEIYSTKTGELRLVAGKSDFAWIAQKKRTKLTKVPVEDNARMIYTDLGVYLGERFGTPCDDL